MADARRDTYDHAFVLLACAWRLKAFGDEQARRVAERTLGFLDTLRQDDGSYLEGDPASLPRRQNPHMHLFEASLALHRAGFEDALDRARAIRALFERHFWDGQVLREFFGDDWSLDSDRGRRHRARPHGRVGLAVRTSTRRRPARTSGASWTRSTTPPNARAATLAARPS